MVSQRGFREKYFFGIKFELLIGHMKNPDVWEKNGEKCQ